MPLFRGQLGSSQFTNLPIVLGGGPPGGSPGSPCGHSTRGNVRALRGPPGLGPSFLRKGALRSCRNYLVCYKLCLFFQFTRYSIYSYGLVLAGECRLADGGANSSFGGGSQYAYASSQAGPSWFHLADYSRKPGSSRENPSLGLCYPHIL